MFGFASVGFWQAFTSFCSASKALAIATGVDVTTLRPRLKGPNVLRHSAKVPDSATAVATSFKGASSVPQATSSPEASASAAEEVSTQALFVSLFSKYTCVVEC